jgi:4-hydroxy 2-oxovalerate aldolase
MKRKEPVVGSEGWLGYRPEIKVVDCTIRDGGLMNDHQFSTDLVRAVYRTACAAGIDYVELGYKGSRDVFSATEFGPWKFCEEARLREVVGEKHEGTRIAVMADAERTDYHRDILPRAESVIDMVRVATYIHQIPTALDMIKDAHDKGYETCVNLMAASTVPQPELEGALEVMAHSDVDVIYLVDSFGTFYSEQIRALMGTYLKHAREAGKEVGIHTHNNCQLAYGNTVEAIICGANYLDASIAGLGRGAGNCQLELLLGFLHNPKFRLRPVLECIRDHIEPLRAKLRWGYSIPYMISGILNRHPREAIKFMESGAGDDIVKFYDDMIEED